MLERRPPARRVDVACEIRAVPEAGAPSRCGYQEFILLEVAVNAWERWRLAGRIAVCSL
jgi:hypothetical protein